MDPTGEGYSESVARILVDHWNTLPRFAQLASHDAGFHPFLIADTPAYNSYLAIPLGGPIIDGMRVSSAVAVLAVVLATGVLVGQTVPSPAVARKAHADYRLDDGSGAVALYPGAGYRSYVEAKFLVWSLHDLEFQMSQIPHGAALHWLPRRWDMNGNPLLFANGQYEQFVRFCGDHGIQLLVERTYRPHLDADGSHSRTVIVAGDQGKTTIEFRSIKVHLEPHAGNTKDYILWMLYDPKTKLFYWQDYELHRGLVPEKDANLADQSWGNMVVYVGSDQMTIFRAGFPGDVGIAVSTKRENSLSRGQTSAIGAFQRKTATPFRRSKSLTYAKQLPPHFFDQCITDINMASIQSVERQTKWWQVTIAAQNGNTAILSLDDSYNLISTKIALNPKADSVGRCK